MDAAPAGTIGGTYCGNPLACAAAIKTMEIMKEEDYSKSIEVFSGSPWEAEIIKGLLESNDIRCVIKDGIMGTLAPYIAPAVSVLVTEDEYESATELIRSRAEKDND